MLVYALGVLTGLAIPPVLLLIAMFVLPDGDGW